jgi:hypothetical protein
MFTIGICFFFAGAILAIIGTVRAMNSKDEGENIKQYAGRDMFTLFMLLLGVINAAIGAIIGTLSVIKHFIG